jgi:hypothetical protein
MKSNFRVTPESLKIMKNHQGYSSINQSHEESLFMTLIDSGLLLVTLSDSVQP